MDENKQKSLNAALAMIEKSFGKGAIMKLGDGAVDEVKTVSTGSLGLDTALGVGGLPYGRIVEVYGPESSGKTTLALTVAANVQKGGGTVAYIDAEHALDPQYAQKLGVNLTDMLISQPDTGEQALEICDMLVRSNAVNLVVVDSVAALVPKAEIEGEMGDSHMGLQARLMSQALRKLTANINRTDTLVIFINQLRMKIGVMFGCFNYSSRVRLADGTSEKIGKIVNNKLEVEVLSYNVNTGLVEPKKIVNWFNNGKADKFYQLVVEGGISGKRTMGVTENHVIFTPEGEKQVSELEIGDEVIVSETDVSLNSDQLQMILGSALGDGSMRISKNKAKASLRYGQGIAQKEYLLWKHSMLSEISTKLRETDRAIFFDTKPYPLFKEFATMLYPVDKKGRKVTAEYLDLLDAKGLACWYMDDGSLSGTFEKWGKGKCLIANKAMDEVSKELVVSWFKSKFGIEVSSVKQGFLISGEDSGKFQELINKYVHPTLDYKLIPKYRSNWQWGRDKMLEPAKEFNRGVPAKILNKYIKPKTKSMVKFDIEVEGNHNYIVDGIVVHNSPETTTGGNALKFYASVRLDIRRTGAVKKGDEVIGSETKVKIVKNKVAPPFKEAHFDIMYGTGIRKVAEVLDLGVDRGHVEKAGSWYSYKGSKLGQGRDSACDFLLDNPEIYAEIEAKLREVVKKD